MAQLAGMIFCLFCAHICYENKSPLGCMFCVLMALINLGILCHQ